MVQVRGDFGIERISDEVRKAELAYASPQSKHAPSVRRKDLLLTPPSLTLSFPCTSFSHLTDVQQVWHDQGG